MVALCRRNVASDDYPRLRGDVGRCLPLRFQFSSTLTSGDRSRADTYDRYREDYSLMGDCRFDVVSATKFFALRLEEDTKEMVDWRAEAESIIRDGGAPGMFHAGHP